MIRFLKCAAAGMLGAAVLVAIAFGVAIAAIWDDKPPPTAGLQPGCAECRGEVLEPTAGEMVYGERAR